MDWESALDLYLLEHQANGRSDRTLVWHRHILTDFAAWCQDRGRAVPRQLKAADLTDWLLHLRTRPSARGGKLAKASVWSYACSVRAFLNWAEDQRVVSRNLAAKLKVKQPRPLPKPFTADELAALWKAVLGDTGIRGARNRALFAWLLDTGCRASEVGGLDLDDVVWERRLALVTGKGSQQRMVAFSPKTAALVKRWLPFRAGTTPALFQTSRKERWTPNGLYQWCERLGNRAGVDKCHPHRFRKTFASQLAVSGDLLVVQQALGHSTLDMARRYAATAPETLRHVHDQFSPFQKLTDRKG